MIMIPPDKVKAFQDDLKQQYGQTSWIIGELVPGDRKVIFGESNTPQSVKVINVADSFLADDA